MAELTVKPLTSAHTRIHPHGLYQVNTHTHKTEEETRWMEEPFTLLFMAYGISEP